MLATSQVAEAWHQAPDESWVFDWDDAFLINAQVPWQGGTPPGVPGYCVRYPNYSGWQNGIAPAPGYFVDNGNRWWGAGGPLGDGRLPGNTLSRGWYMSKTDGLWHWGDYPAEWPARYRGVRCGPPGLSPYQWVGGRPSYHDGTPWYHQAGGGWHFNISQGEDYGPNWVPPGWPNEDYEQHISDEVFNDGSVRHSIEYGFQSWEYYLLPTGGEGDVHFAPQPGRQTIAYSYHYEQKGGWRWDPATQTFVARNNGNPPGYPENGMWEQSWIPGMTLGMHFERTGLWDYKEWGYPVVWGMGGGVDPTIGYPQDAATHEFLALTNQKQHRAFQAIWGAAKTWLDIAWVWQQAGRTYVSQHFTAMYCIMLNVPYYWAYAIADASLDFTIFITTHLAPLLPETSVSRVINGNIMLRTINVFIPLQEVLTCMTFALSILGLYVWLRSVFFGFFFR